MVQSASELAAGGKEVGLNSFEKGKTSKFPHFYRYIHRLTPDTLCDNTRKQPYSAAYGNRRSNIKSKIILFIESLIEQMQFDERLMLSFSSDMPHICCLSS